MVPVNRVSVPSGAIWQTPPRQSAVYSAPDRVASTHSGRVSPTPTAVSAVSRPDCEKVVICGFINVYVNKCFVRMYG